MSPVISVTAFYKFQPIPEDRVSALRQELKNFGKINKMRGLVLVATEGINGTVCGAADIIDQWKQLMTMHFGKMRWNDSSADQHIFPRWFVKIREEIVALKQPDVRPNGEHQHLSPAEWNRMMEEEDVIVLDTRNDYETAIGAFEGAIDPKLTQFQEFATFVSNAGLPKDKKIMMYCTGGIRCEKALIAMEKQGYEHVYQLKGGILGYLKEFPQGKFTGECFVFDSRVAVDRELRPSRNYGRCPHCGDPAPASVNCRACDASCKVCERCIRENVKNTCSKRCRGVLKAKREREQPVMSSAVD